MNQMFDAYVTSGLFDRAGAAMFALGDGSVRFESGDAFDTLHALKTAGERFDGIVLDPPKFARNRGGVEAYRHRTLL